MSDSQSQSDIQENSIVRTPHWVTGIIVGVLVILIIMFVDLSFRIDILKDIGCEYIRQPFSTWPHNLKISTILRPTKVALIIPVCLLLLYVLFRGSLANTRKSKFSVPLILILISVICSSCYVSSMIALHQAGDAIFWCNPRML